MILLILAFIFWHSLCTFLGMRLKALLVFTLSLTVLLHAGVARSSIETFHGNHLDGYHGIAFIIGPEIQAANTQMVYQMGLTSAMQQNTSKYTSASNDGESVFSNESVQIEQPTFSLADKKLMGYLSSSEAGTSFEQTAINL